MQYIFSFLWLFFFALIAPVGLPAGGWNKNNIDNFECNGNGQYFAGGSCSLRSYPNIKIRPARAIKLGTPITILRYWQGNSNDHWYYVQLDTSEILDFSSSIRRGWIKS